MPGTPKTLIEAIENGNEQHVRSRSSYTSARASKVKSHVQDYLSQHFTKTMLEHPESEEILKALFERIVK